MESSINISDVVENFGGNIGRQYRLVRYVLDQKFITKGATEKQKKDKIDYLKEAYQSFAFLCGIKK